MAMLGPQPPDRRVDHSPQWAQPAQCPESCPAGYRRQQVENRTDRLLELRRSEMTTMAKEQFRPAQEQERLTLEQIKSQYTFGQIISIWLAAGAPMWILGWLVYPALSQDLTTVD